MSDNVKIIQGLYDAFAAGDMQSIATAFASDISWTEADGFPYAGTYIGMDEILNGVFMKLGTEWDGWSAIPHRHVAEGDTVITLGEYRGTYKATGKALKVPLVHVWELADGKVKTFVQHTDTAIVLEAMK